MKKGDKVLIKECPVKKYIGKEGVITNVTHGWECGDLYKVSVGDVTIKNWATDDCLELIVDKLSAANIYDTEEQDIKRFVEHVKSKNYKKEEECYYCKHKYNIPGNAHIGCRKFGAENVFASYGIANGWVVNIPSLGISCFDPIWKETFCTQFEEQE